MEEKEYSSLTPKLAIQLAAPHTWVASIFPCLIGVCAGAANMLSISVSMTASLLVISVLMQSAVNTFNDYYDYVKGSDSPDDNVEVSDATLVYNNINPSSALILAIGFLAIALLFGIYVILKAGWVPFAIGAFGGIFVIAYSGGKTPISYLPIGEAVSGIVMGGLIMIASCYCTLGYMNWISIVWSIPTIIGVALVMLTNNTCDIEKDVVADRRTLPVILGREKSRTLYHAMMIAWVISIIAIVAIWFTNGAVLVPFLLLGMWPFFKNLWNNPLAPNARIAAMGQICTLNAFLGSMYSLCILAKVILGVSI